MIYTITAEIPVTITATTVVDNALVKSRETQISSAANLYTTGCSSVIMYKAATQL